MKGLAVRPSRIVYAHRGASLERPENTLEAFELALALGADAIETDAHETRDGRIVLTHDETGERTAGVRRRVRDVSLVELRSWNVGHGSKALGRHRIPTLDEALASFPDTFFNIDVKPVAASTVRAIVRTVERASAASRVRLTSFSETNLRAIRKSGYEGPLGLSAWDVVPSLLLPNLLTRGRHLRGDAVQVPLREAGLTFASPRAIDRFHRLGLRVDFWTVDDPAVAQALVAMGADGIVTNDPRTVVPAVRSIAP